MMPHVIAKMIGPRLVAPPHANVAPTAPVLQARLQTARSHRRDYELDDGHAPDGSAVVEPAEEHLPDPVVPDVATSAAYRRLFGDAPLHEAVLDVFCRMAVLSGRLMGDNVASPHVMSEKDMCGLADEATDFIVDYVDVLFGPVNTTKAHRLANHLLKHLLNQGNLWAGDTSENESLHRVCMRMFYRSNKRGPSIVLQMMRAAETQTKILRELYSPEESRPRGDGGLLGSMLQLFPPADGPEQLDGDVDLTLRRVLPRSRRGDRCCVAELEREPGMNGLARALGVSSKATVVVASSVAFHCAFEWGARSEVQTVWATPSFEGKPRFSHIRFTDDDGVTRFGSVRLVLRVVGDRDEDCMIVRMMQETPALPRCSLTRSKCQRLAWAFASATDDWPQLVKVPLASLLRLEHIVPDFRDLGDRHGLHSRPSVVPDTADERRAQRFFTNAFFPWTSRAQHPDE